MMDIKDLEISVSIGCRNMCSYCPQEKIIKAYKDEPKKHMSFVDFKSIMKSVPKSVRITFAGFSELWFNPEASEMMKYTIQQGYNTHLYTTLKGFSENDLKVLKGLTFGDVVFHKYDGRGFDLDEFNSNMEIFKENIHSNGVYRLAVVNQTGDPKDGGTDMWSRGGNLFDVKSLIGPVYCSSATSITAFDHNIVIPTGDVFLCCMDYGLEHKIGNLLETPYDKLDRSEIVRLANQKDSKLICRKCEVCKLVYALPYIYNSKSWIK